MSDRKIADAIRALAHSGFTDELYFVAATVDSVDIASGTCSVTAVSGDSALSIPDVKLQAAVGDGILVTPAIGSVVFVGYTKRNEPYIQLFSDVDHFLFVAGGKSAVELFNDGTIKLNDGSYGGLIKIQALITRLNNIENLLSDLITKYNSHSHPSNGSPTATIETGTITNTQRSDIENVKISHGT